VEALIEIVGSVFEVIFEWRKDRAERGLAKDETVAYQLGGRDGQPQDSQPQDSQQGLSVGTSSRRGIRQ